jgi:2-succinyl-5-enolpyruvyl-6-hydroxy-3-cyclohexene-1-carboxylate synthase
LQPDVAKFLLTTVALSMALTPVLAEAGCLISERIENKYGFSHYVGSDAESKAMQKTQSDFVVVCGYGRIGKMVCDLLDKKLIPYVAFDVNPSKVHTHPSSHTTATATAPQHTQDDAPALQSVRGHAQCKCSAVQ